jgi:stage II sporulation protein P
MQNDKDIVELIKKAYPLEPRKSFVTETQQALIKSARRMNRKRRIKRLSLAALGLALCVTASSFFQFSDGAAQLKRSFSNFVDNDIASETSDAEPYVYIYHTHNQESFRLKEPSGEVFEENKKSKRISLIGNKLSNLLDEKGITTIHEQKDVSETVKERGWTFSDSYKVSREYFTQTLEDHKNMKLALDIHRDSRKKGETTLESGNKKYARIVFVVSRSSSRFEENLEVAELFHEKLEQKVPGISIGVKVKSKDNTQEQSTYNQDLIDQTMLVNIGGYENTMEEEFRTLEVFAEVIKEYMINEVK